MNDTRVVPARIRGRRASGGEAEVLLLERLGERPSGRRSRGRRGGCGPASGSAPAELVEPLGEGRWRVRLDGAAGG